HLAQALRHRHAPAPDADQPKVLGTVILFDNFVDQADQGTLDFRRGHQLRFLAQAGWTGRGFGSHERCIITGRTDAGQGARSPYFPMWARASRSCKPNPYSLVLM